MSPELKSFRSYNKPPVFERVASLQCSVDEEIFARGLESWKTLVEPDFPIYEPLQQWLYKSIVRDEMVLLDPTQGTLELTPRFSKKTSAEGFDWSIRCSPEQFTMNMHSSPESSGERRYPKLHYEYARWLPKWLEHFKPVKIHTLEMLYLNVLNIDTIPLFVTPDGLQLGQVIKLFPPIGSEYKSAIPPYECTLNLALKEREGSFVSLKVLDYPPKGGHLAVRLDISCRTGITPGTEDNPEKILELLNWCHERIIFQFEDVFTNEAKTQFEPISLS
ncbi:MAG: hypothetical protein HC904_14420 [Blastochloris sp.]|nr:hypothetical protein [Blastochloris sp.]